MSCTRGSSSDSAWNSGCSFTPTMPLSTRLVRFSSTDRSGWTVPIGTSRSRGTLPMNSLVRATVDALMPTPRASPLSMPALSIDSSRPDSLPLNRSDMPAGVWDCIASAM